MPYPPDMLEPLDAPDATTPAESVEFRRELAALLNRHGVDNWAEIPDHILADMLAELIVPVRWGRIATAKWMGQPLLGEKLSATPRREHTRQGDCREADPAGGVPGCPACLRPNSPAWVEDTTPVANNPYPPGDPRGFNEYQPCRTDLCAAARCHTDRCAQARQRGASE